MNDLGFELRALVAADSPVLADIERAVGTAAVKTFYVRPETVFDADSVYERIVAFIVTESHLLLSYSDTNYEMDPAGEYVTTTQAVRLDQIKEYHVVRRRKLRATELSSITLRLRWGSSFTQDLQPGACEDPNCTNDHGYIGLVTNEDVQIFLDRNVDGQYFDAGVEFINRFEQIVKEL